MNVEVRIENLEFEKMEHEARMADGSSPEKLDSRPFGVALPMGRLTARTGSPRE